MALIKKFRNGRPIDPTDPNQTIILSNQPPQQINPPQKVPTSTPKRGGCGCGKK